MATTLQRSSSSALFDKAQSLFPGGVNECVHAWGGRVWDPAAVCESGGVLDLWGNRNVHQSCLHPRLCTPSGPNYYVTEKNTHVFVSFTVAGNAGGGGIERQNIVFQLRPDTRA